MPLYEFTCHKCGAVFEEILTFAEMQEGHLKCPHCSSRQVEKSLSTFSTGTAASDTACGAPAGSCGTGGFT
jgi:putative FmdB family regulatory protein